MDVHWLMGQDLSGEVDAQTLVWVVGVSQRDHLLDPEEQSNQGEGGGCGDNTEAVPCRPHAT